MALAPDPFDAEIERVLAHPDFKAEMAALRAREERGEAVTYDDAEVRRRLRDRSVPLLDPPDAE